MTAKEKARELIDKFQFVYIQYSTSMHEVKQCALIAADEAEKSFIEVMKYYEGSELNFNSWFHFNSYWQQVREEIDNYKC